MQVVQPAPIPRPTLPRLAAGCQPAATKNSGAVRIAVRSVPSAARARGCGDGLHHAVEVEAARLLARRKLLEALQPVAHVGGRRRGLHAHPAPLAAATQGTYAIEQACTYAVAYLTIINPNRFPSLGAASQDGAVQLSPLVLQRREDGARQGKCGGRTLASAHCTAWCSP